MYNICENFLSFLDDIKEIPRKIHVSWKENNFGKLVSSDNPMILNGIQNLKDMNPDWDLKISNDEEVEEYIKSNIDKSDYSLLKDVDIVAKTDVWRLIKMYNEGGLYMDIDRYYNIPLQEIITPKVKCLLPMHLDLFFSQDTMCSVAGNPIYSCALDLGLTQRRNGNDDILDSGPRSYSHGITKVVFDELISTPFKDKTNDIVNSISNCNSLKTFKEGHGKSRTLFFDPLKDGWKEGNGFSKANFYSSQGTEHWKKRYRKNGR